ncbi:MAG: GNAT family N-acetyltransferase [Acidimicrobiales bacterium]
MSAPPLLGRDDLRDIGALCRRSIPDAPTVDELDGALFSPDQPCVVRGDPAVGVVATVEVAGATHVRLLAVDPSARRRGHGQALVEAAETQARAAGTPSLTFGADPPYFLWPGVPSTATALLCLLERRHYSRVDTNFDMTVELAQIPDDPGGHALARAGERDEVDRWTAAHWPNWRPEVLRALDKGNLVLAREGDRPDGDITAFCAFEVNRAGFLGPVAVRPDLLGQGRGRPALVGALHELRRRGRDRVAVVWVGPVRPYAAVGGAVSTVSFVLRRELG